MWNQYLNVHFVIQLLLKKKKNYVRKLHDTDSLLVKCFV